MSTPVRALLLAALLTLAPVTIGVAVAGDPTPGPARPAYTATDLQDFDTAKVIARRSPFCDRIPAAAGRAALGADATVAAYGNGQDAPAPAGAAAGDVAHEFGCVLAPAEPAPAGTTSPQALGWVFAPPVTAERAAELVAVAPAAGCTTRADAPAYGTPSVARVCASEAARTASYRGLFGDAWLSCSLTLPAAVPEDELFARTGRWCVSVARAASGTAP